MTKQELYYSYKYEMWQYDTQRKAVPTISEAIGEADSVLHEYCTSWVDIYPQNGETEPCGFLIVGTEGNCPPESDYFIEACYVAPMYRKRGFAKKAISDFAKSHKGRYVTFVGKNNRQAKGLFATSIKDMEAKPNKITDFTGLYPDCEQLSFVI
ncbi:MAG: GNAT family N-acetyltransferase [Lachnospiraceae bacterium]|nr:GNAT family N-acetyltransferase [Lachnospiraceae bacterium]